MLLADIDTVAWWLVQNKRFLASGIGKEESRNIVNAFGGSRKPSV